MGGSWSYIPSNCQVQALKAKRRSLTFNLRHACDDSVKGRSVRLGKAWHRCKET